MASKAQAISITDIQEHKADCADCGADGRFDQEYVVPLPSMATLLTHVAKANGCGSLCVAEASTFARRGETRADQRAGAPG
jgi:hypothetical protein